MSRIASTFEKLARAHRSALIPFVTAGQRMEGIPKLQYKLLRSLIPHSKLPNAEALKSQGA